ncbi:hypothetical protein [Thiocapsa imhoffii]|uniref:hypothetical protein n=1 Tax=Thiocapsa imhoffii TaxID=382777 RepID=UPI0019045483|nr:hypothetical protein [Thiocapsa imhoffii]
MAAQKKQRPLIRYAGSAAETSIGSKPIGSELNARVYPEWPACQAGLALAQTLAYLPTLRQTAGPNARNNGVTLCPNAVYGLARIGCRSQSRLPESLSDNLRPIGNSRAIENGRYAQAYLTNRCLISITTGTAGSIAAQLNLSHSRTHP